MAARRWACCFAPADAQPVGAPAHAGAAADSGAAGNGAASPAPAAAAHAGAASPPPALRLLPFRDGGASAAGGGGTPLATPLSTPRGGRAFSGAGASTSGAPGSYSAAAGPPSPAGLRRDSVRVSFERAARDLREVHAFRPPPPPIRLRHPPAADASSASASAAGASARRRARTTTAAALGTDASGAKCVNQYVKLRKLGQGSYAKVLLYRSREDDTLYAIKARACACACARLWRGSGALR
jgi:hypothetical protein